MFSPFQEYLKKAINQHGMHDVVMGAEACAKFDKLKSKIFPEDTANTLTALHFKNGALTIEVPDSVWAHAVITRKDALIAELNATFGQTVIERIKTELVNQQPPDTAEAIDTN